MRSFLLVWNYYHQNLLFTAQANVKPLFSKEAGYNQRFLVYSVSFINFLVIFSISFAVCNNVVFWAVCISILILILYFSKFFVTLPRALKTTGIMSIFLKFQSLWISLTFHSLLLFLVNYSLVPTYCHIYDYCCPTVVCGWNFQ